MFKNTIAMWLVPVFSVSGVASAQVSSPVVQKSEISRNALSGYASVFANYKPYLEEKSLDWKEANRQVERRGGWRQYAKEAQEPEAQPEVPAPRTVPSPGAVAPKTKP